LRMLPMAWEVLCFAILLAVAVVRAPVSHAKAISAALSVAHLRITRQGMREVLCVSTMAGLHFQTAISTTTMPSMMEIT